MAEFGPQYPNPLPENPFPVVGAGAHWDANILLGPRHPRVPPLPPHRPIPVQLPGDARAPQNVMFPPVNPARNRWPDGHWEDNIPQPVENIAGRGQPQDMQFNYMDYYDMDHYPPLPHAGLAPPNGYNDRGINHYARLAHGVPAQAQAIAPPAPEMDIFDAGRNAEAGPAQAFLDELPNQAPIVNEPAAEVLRRLANHYLNELASQVDMVRMEPGPAGGIRVVITLELADLL